MGQPIETIDPPGIDLFRYKFSTHRLSLHIRLQTCPETLCIFSTSTPCPVNLAAMTANPAGK